MCGEQGFIAVHETVYETVHLVKFIGKGCSIFFSSAYVTLLSTTGYKVLKLCLLYIGIMLKKHFKNAHCEFYEQFSCRKRMFPIQILGMQSLSGASKVTKPIFSNSGMKITLQWELQLAV